MRTITISKTVSRTYNLGDYENYKPSFTITETFELPDDTQVDLVQTYKNKFAQFTTVLKEELAKEKSMIGR